MLICSSELIAIYADTDECILTERELHINSVYEKSVCQEIVDDCDAEQNTLLMKESLLGRTGLCQQLLVIGININYKDVDGRTALVYTSARGN